MGWKQEAEPETVTEQEQSCEGELIQELGHQYLKYFDSNSVYTKHKTKLAWYHAPP